MFSNIFSLAWHIKKNLFTYLFIFCFSLSLYLFSFRFLPLYLLIHFGFSLFSFASIHFHSLFYLVSLTFFCLLASSRLDLIFALFFLYAVASSFVLFRSILFSQSEFVLINNQLYTLFSMYLFPCSTCFEQPSVNHQENQLYQYIIWYISLWK